MICESEIASFKEAAIAWLVNSGIQESDADNPGYGGFYQSYNTRVKAHNFIYSEITGYGISLLCNLYGWAKEPIYLTLARRAAEYLLTAQYRGEPSDVHGAFRYGPDWQRKLERANEFYSFDNAVCISGMVDIHHLTNDSRYLEAALLAGDWLVTEAQYPDGAFRSMYDLDQGGFDHTKLRDIWYEDRACLNAKNTLGLVRLHAASNRSVFRERAIRTGDWVLGLQNPDGSIRVNENHAYIFTHAHCYAVEGLFYLYAMTGSEKHRQAALEGGNWLLSKQDNRGRLFEDYQRGILDLNIGRMKAKHPAALLNAMTGPLFRRIRSDVLAQSVRIWVLSYHLTGEEKYLSASERTLHFLVKMQCKDIQGPNADKGLRYSARNLFGSYRYSSALTAWSTMFYIHALHMLETALTGRSFEGAIAGLF